MPEKDIHKSFTEDRKKEIARVGGQHSISVASVTLMDDDNF